MVHSNSTACGTGSDVARVGLVAPAFELESLRPDSNNVSTLRLEDFADRWLLLIFYPRDFSFVCPTEISAFSTRMQEFAERDCEIVGVSVDSIDTHRKWMHTSADEGGVFGLRFALGSDMDGAVSRAYGVYHEHGQVAGRGMFIIDPQGVLQYQAVHNMSVGRSTDETLRVIDALRDGGICPAGWTRADGTIDPLLDLSEGRVFGHYRIERLLGEGGFGWVYAACDLLLDRRVAMKIGRTTSPATREAVLREARAAAKLAHANVCTVLSVEEILGVPLIVMEYLPGESLAHRLAGGPPLEPEAASIAKQIASAIAASHAAGVSHGDIKPANILFATSGEAKVADFGMARAVTLDRPATGEEAPGSLDGSIRGTPAYMSPEQTEGGPATPEADVFSTGLLLYELLTGHRAIRARGAAESLAAIRNLDSTGICAQLPENYRKTVAAMLTPEASDRPTMAEVLRQLP